MTDLALRLFALLYLFLGVGLGVALGWWMRGGSDARRTRRRASEALNARVAEALGMVDALSRNRSGPLEVGTFFAEITPYVGGTPNERHAAIKLALAHLIASDVLAEIGGCVVRRTSRGAPFREAG